MYIKLKKQNKKSDSKYMKLKRQNRKSDNNKYK